MARARAIVSGEVHGAPESSTIGTTCGGLTGCATRQRWRPSSFSVKREVTMAEDDEARIALAGAAASRRGEQLDLDLDPLRPALDPPAPHPARPPRATRPPRCAWPRPPGPWPGHAGRHPPAIARSAPARRRARPGLGPKVERSIRRAKTHWPTPAQSARLPPTQPSACASSAATSCRSLARTVRDSPPPMPEACRRSWGNDLPGLDDQYARKLTNAAMTPTKRPLER